MPRQAAVTQHEAALSPEPEVAAVTTAPASSPGEVSRLAAHLQGLALAEGTGTGWCVALKPPKSVQLVVLDCAGNGQWAETTADTWLQRVLLHQDWTGWVAYNDETPEGSKASGTKFAHAKGILAWRKDRIGWLIHSVPAWPEAMSNDELPPLVASGQRCGQSFLFLSLPRTGDMLRRICDQISLMDACCYTGRVRPDEEADVPFREDRWGEHLKRSYKLQAPSLVPLGSGLWHLAKDAAWGKMWVDGRPTDLDFYEDGLARTPPFEGFWHVQSWLNGNCPPFGRTQHCDNILQIRLPDGRPYETAKDHAKWAVHRDKPLVLVGDLNRTQTQAKRGGGGVIIQDEGLWRALTSVVHQVGADHPPLPSPLSSYDEFHSTGLSGGVGRAGAGQLLQVQAGAVGGVARLPWQGRRRVSTAAARGEAEADGSGRESQAGSIQSSGSTSVSGSSRGCKCKKGCSHGRCGCKRAGQPCGPQCGCKGDCANGAAVTEASSAAMVSMAEALTESQGAEAGTAGTAGTAGQPAELPPPEEAAAAISAAMERFAAASAAAAAVSALAPVVQQQQQGDEQAAVEAVEGSPSAVATPVAATSSSLAMGSDGPASSSAASQQPEQHGEEGASAGEARCSCQKGCKDRRCPCRKAGRVCGGRCTCQGCSNTASAGAGTGAGAGGSARRQAGCTVC